MLKFQDYVFDQMLHRGERGLVACGSLPLLRVNRTAVPTHQRSVELSASCAFPETETHNGSIAGGRYSKSMTAYYVGFHCSSSLMHYLILS